MLEHVEIFILVINVCVQNIMIKIIIVNNKSRRLSFRLSSWRNRNFLTGGPYYLAYQEIALNRDGKCGDNNKICKDDCCDNIKEYCRHQVSFDNGAQCAKDRGC